MKKQTVLLVFTICTMALSFAQTSSKTQEKLTINTSKSEIKWSADYAFYFGGHYGTIMFKEGFFIKSNDVISGGEFVIDMHSIKNTDIEKEDANLSLVDHLKDGDFFDVKKFPTAKLIITNVIYHDPTHMKIIADLTIKGKTMPIDFQAEVDFKTKQMLTKFKIDRTRWEINYGSKSLKENLQNSVISDAIGFEVKLSL
ncbi:YceI family protein [uncultured Psychroserpens sp.]|uniref:YceI family protein n=1 Tax=uncultured Psychroserpens sp. TaxID=255436 RepID=UPI00263A0C93|nr:YceI family protein [uncultured Psychroserpens sp.]